MNRDTWLAAHPYLRPVGEVDALVAAALDAIDPPVAPVPDWAAYAADFKDGVPLVESSSAAIDLVPAKEAILPLTRKLATAPLPGVLAEQCRALEEEVSRAEPGDVHSPMHPGLFRYLACVVLARYLSGIVRAFDTWRDEERWLRNYCPTCGERPSMGQLLGKDPGRLRKLSCGCCRTRWRYRRTGCPFCDRQDEHRLAVVSIDGEAGLRIDYCETCGGYLKTYDGEGMENVLLADWTSLHLDLLARDRGLKRLAASLYDV